MFETIEELIDTGHSDRGILRMLREDTRTKDGPRGTQIHKWDGVDFETLQELRVNHARAKAFEEVCADTERYGQRGMKGRGRAMEAMEQKQTPADIKNAGKLRVDD